jgi:large subunit ribosomal protein L21
MYAIVEISGHQYKVAKNDVVFVHKLAKNADEKFDIDRVLLVADDKGTVNVGTPVVEGAKVSATVLAQVKADKILVYKKKRRKGYEKRRGHRQQLTKLKIESISL